MDKTKTFEPDTITLRDLFSGSVYSVPEYQRLYSWTDDQIIKLWDDFYEAYENSGSVSNYFLGSVITVPTSEGGDTEDIIDGQQRITTLTILFATICEMCKCFEEFRDKHLGNNNKDIEEIKNLYLKEEDTRLVLQKQENLDVEFSAFIKEDINKKLCDSEFKKPRTSEIRGSGQKKKYENALFLFKERLENFQGNLKEFVDFILKK